MIERWLMTFRRNTQVFVGSWPLCRTLPGRFIHFNLSTNSLAPTGIYIASPSECELDHFFSPPLGSPPRLPPTHFWQPTYSRTTPISMPCRWGRKKRDIGWPCSFRSHFVCRNPLWTNLQLNKGIKWINSRNNPKPLHITEPSDVKKTTRKVRTVVDSKRNMLHRHGSSVVFTTIF